MTLLNLREKGYDVIRYTTKSGKSLEYSATDDEEWTIVKKLIEKPAPGAQWRALYYAAPTVKQHSTTKGSGKSFVEGFTTLSDEEFNGNVSTFIGSPKKSGGRKSTVKKTGTMAKNFTSKSLAKVKSSKKRAEDNEGGKAAFKKNAKKNVGKESSSLKEHGAMKEPVKKKHPKQKNAIKAANTSAKKGKGTKFGRDKKSDNVNAGGYGQAKPSNKRKGKVTVLEFDSDDGSLDLDDEEGYAKLLEQVKEESKRDISHW